MLTRTARSIGETLNAVAGIRSVWGIETAPTEELWFRGNEFRSHELRPALYRENVATYGYDELTLFETFKALATPLVRSRPASDWEWYFTAQHYGLLWKRPIGVSLSVLHRLIDICDRSFVRLVNSGAGRVITGNAKKQ